MATAKADRLQATLERLFSTLQRLGYDVTPSAASEATAILFDEVARSGGQADALRRRLTPIFAVDRLSQQEIGLRIEAAFASAPVSSGREAEVEAVGKRVQSILAAVVVGLAVLAVAVWFGLFSEAEDVVDRASDADGPRPEDVQPPPQASDTELLLPETVLVDVAETVWHPARPWFLVFAALVPLVLFLLWWAIRTLLRRVWLSRAGLQTEGPDPAMAQYFDRSGIPGASGMQGIARDLGAGLSEPGQKIDLRRTVQATVRSAGYLTPIAEKIRGAADYVVLIERKNANDHLAHLVNVLLSRVEAAGVRLRRFYYREDPRLARPADGSAEPQSLSDLSALMGRHRLVVVGDSAGFFHPLTGDLHPWTQAFDVFTSRTLLNAREVGNWGFEEDALLSSGFLVGSASPDGLSAYGRAVASGADTVGRKAIGVPDVRPAVASDDVDHSDASMIAGTEFSFVIAPVYVEDGLLIPTDPPTESEVLADQWQTLDAIKDALVRWGGIVQTRGPKDKSDLAHIWLTSPPIDFDDITHHFEEGEEWGRFLRDVSTEFAFDGAEESYVVVTYKGDDARRWTSGSFVNPPAARRIRGAALASVREAKENPDHILEMIAKMRRDYLGLPDPDDTLQHVDAPVSPVQRVQRPGIPFVTWLARMVRRSLSTFRSYSDVTFRLSDLFNPLPLALIALMLLTGVVGWLFFSVAPEPGEQPPTVAASQTGLAPDVELREVTPFEIGDLIREAIASGQFADNRNLSLQQQLAGAETVRTLTSVRLRNAYLSGTDTLSEIGSSDLTVIARVLAPLAVDISVEVHTDTVQPGAASRFEDNMALGLARAEAAADFLRAALPRPDRVTAVTFGENRPVASNDTAEGRAQNRRIEIVITPAALP